MLINSLRTNKIYHLNYLKYVSKHVPKQFSSLDKVTPVKLSFANFDNTDATNDEKEVPFVVMHGLFGSKQNWTSLCKAYSQKIIPPRKIIALDLRNHGESEHSEDHSYLHLVEDVKQFLEENNLEKVALMGHSMGGRCAMLFALTYPEYLEKLIIVDISPVTLSPNLNEMPKVLECMHSVEMPQNVPLSKARAVVEKQLEHVIFDKDVRAFILTNLIGTENQSYKWRVNIPTLIKRFSEIAKFPEVNKQYAGSTLFVGGENSDFIPKSDYPKILKLFPKAELKYIEGAGHWVHAEKPTHFLKLTLEFLNRKEPSPS